MVVSREIHRPYVLKERSQFNGGHFRVQPWLSSKPFLNKEGLCGGLYAENGATLLVEIW